MTNNLNQLNFNDLLVVETADIDSYDFTEYMTNDKHIIRGFCTRCEEKGCNICPTDSSFRLQNISHGATTNDIIIATDQQHIDFADWHNEGVLFLMEGPSVDSGFYEEHEFNGYTKNLQKNGIGSMINKLKAHTHNHLKAVNMDHFSKA